MLLFLTFCLKNIIFHNIFLQMHIKLDKNYYLCTINRNNHHNNNGEQLHNPGNYPFTRE